MIHRNPPQDLDAEAALVGSYLICTDSTLIAEIDGLVDTSDFYQPDHAMIWEAAQRLRHASKPVDAITVRAELQAMGKLADVGGTAFIGDCLKTVPSSAHAAEYARRVRAASRRRRLIALGDSLASQGYSDTCERSAQEIASYGIQVLTGIVSESAGTEYIDFDHMMFSTFEEITNPDKRPMITTGWNSLDVVLGGIAPGEELLIGARPSMGKSTAMRQMALRMAQRGVPVGYISREETSSKIMRNLFAAECEIENKRIRGGNLTEGEIKIIAESMNKNAGLPLYLTERHGTIDEIRAIVGVWIAKHGIKCVFLDYLTLINTKGKDLYERASLASKGFKQMLKDFQIAGVVAVQLNREAPKRDDKRPTITDIRESGQIEQDADFILFLHREDYYRVSEAGYHPDHVAELIVAKARDSVRGATVRLHSDMRYQLFRDTLSQEVDNDVPIL